MLLRSIRLKNIRSYLDERIEFPLGSTLLSGDVGSGKSTILQAIEFALFGTRRSDLAGSHLLRHGKDSGHVELDFTIGNNNVTIKRSLRRTGNISQDSCVLEINGVRADYMPTEMKARILEMFGYPREALTRDIPIFRYTVYTPQEEMKHIMLDPESRLLILRKIFNIEKYGQVRANAAILLSEIRSTKRSLEEYAKDLDRWVQERDEKERNITAVNRDISKVGKDLENVNAKITDLLKAVDSVRQETDTLYKLKNELSRKDAEVKSKLGRKTQVEKDALRYDGKIKSLQLEIEKYYQITKPAGAAELKTSLARFENERVEISSNIAVINSEINKMKKILESGRCAVCGQAVHNAKEFQASIDEKISQGHIYRSRLEVIEQSISAIKHQLEELEVHALKAERKLHLQKSLSETEQNRKELGQEMSELNLAIEKGSSEIAALSLQLQGFDTIDKRYKELEDKLKAENDSRLATEKEKSRLEQQLKDLESSILSLSAEIEKREKANDKIRHIEELSNWLENHFSALMEVIEKNVMIRIHHEFVTLFQKWFDILMQNELLSVKLDENFSPIIQQNGYETEYGNLSGGEKTAIALAYRLALNKVVNDIVDTIKTKDTLILDEPTDGFSSEQLDRIRDVINELKLKQIIIVSHETKIDTFVDNVIRVHKDNHVSSVVR